MHMLPVSLSAEAAAGLPTLNSHEKGIKTLLAISLLDSMFFASNIEELL